MAEAIISGDAHILNLAEWSGIPILTPAAFLNNFFPA
jgi:predicted nucleic acid-binding protein